MYHLGGVSAKDVQVDVEGGHAPRRGVVRLRRRPFGIEDVVEYRQNESHLGEWSCWGRFGPKYWPPFLVDLESLVEQLAHSQDED